MRLAETHYPHTNRRHLPQSRACAVAGWLVVVLCLLAPARALGAGFYIQVGDILTANYLGNRIVKVDPASGAQQTLGVAGTFTAPTDLALSAAGDLYVGELGGDIKRLDVAAGTVTVINPTRSLTSVRGLTLGPDGNLYVTGRNGTADVVMRVHPATGAETLITEWAETTLPVGIEFLDATHIVVALWTTSEVIEIDLTDSSERVIASGGTTIDQPWALAVSGNLVYSGHYDSKNINEINAATLAVRLVGSVPGKPYGMAIDADGNLLVGSSATTVGQQDMLVRLTPAGTVAANFSVGLNQQISGIEVSTIQIGSPPVNDPPVLDAIGAESVDEGSPLSVQITASDTDLPSQTLTFTLDAGAPAGAAITTSGLFSWIPAEVHGPGTYPITVRVTDDGAPPMSDTATLSVTVNEVNLAPVVTPIARKDVTAGSLLSFSCAASDADLPPQNLSFSLGSGSELGAAISAGGVFTWTPAVALAPGTNTFIVVVTDNGPSPLSGSNTVTVVVHEVNTPPSLTTTAPQTIDEGSTLNLALTATDTNRPAQTLTYSLGPGAPAGANLTPGGAFSWTPAESQGPGVFPISVVVTDNGLPPLASTNVFQVTVNEVNAPPVLMPVAEQTIMAGNLLSVVLTATDPDLPAQSLTFGVAGTAPPGVSVSPQGVLSWTPANNQAPHTYPIAVRVQDSGTPAVASTQTVSVVVRPRFVVEVGDVLAADMGGGSVLKIRPETGAQELMEVFDSPTDLALSPQGMVYVSESGGLIKQFNLTNGAVTVVNPASPLPDAQCLVLGPDGALFVTIATGDRVVRVDPASGSVTTLSELGLLSGPSGIDVLDAGHLVVGSHYNNRLVSIALADGAQTLIAEDNGLIMPWGVAVSGSDIYVASYGALMVHRVSGGVVHAVHALDQGLPAGIAVAGNGELLASAIGLETNLVLRISPQGALLDTYAEGVLGAVAGLEVARFRVGPELPTNSAPVVWDDILERQPTNGGKVLIATLVGNDVDVDGDPIQFVAASATSLHGGTVERTGDWIVYTPPAGFTNVDSFTYTITDGYNPDATGTVFVLVNPDLVPSPNLVLTDLGNGSFLLRFDGIPGRTYRIQRTGSLSPADWQTLGSNTADGFGVFLFNHTPPAAEPQGFYRSVDP